MPYDIRYRLEELRKLRSEQRRHAQIAEDAMGRATVAMSTKRWRNGQLPADTVRPGIFEAPRTINRSGEEGGGNLDGCPALY